MGFFMVFPLCRSYRELPKVRFHAEVKVPAGTAASKAVP